MCVNGVKQGFIVLPFPSLAVVENLRFTFPNLLLHPIIEYMLLIYKGLQAQTTTCCAVA